MSKNRNYKLEGRLLSAAQFALLAGTAIVSPVETIAAALYTSVENTYRVAKYKKVFDKDMQSYVHYVDIPEKISDRVISLYNKAGIKGQGYKLYSGIVFESTKDKKDIAAVKNSFNSKARNLFASGMAFSDKDYKIIASSSLIRYMNEDEMHAILAHEVSHVKNKDSFVSFLHGCVDETVERANKLKFLGAVATINNSPLMPFGEKLAGAINKVVNKSALTPIIDKTKYLANAVFALPVAGFYSLFRDRKIQADKKRLIDRKNHAIEGLKIKRFFKIGKAATELTIVGLASLYNPAVAAIWAGAKLLTVASKIAHASYVKNSEYRADAEAIIKYDADPVSLIKALRKLEMNRDINIDRYMHTDDNDRDKVLMRGKLSKAWEELTATHPSNKKRFKNIEKVSMNMGYSKKEIENAKSCSILNEGYVQLPYDIVRDSIGVNFNSRLSF